MKKQLAIFSAFVLFAFLSCEKSEVSEFNNEFNNETLNRITECETGFGSSDHCFSEDGFSRWGWVIGPLTDNSEKTVHEIWAAAGQCELENGTLVGHLYVDYYEGVATITYDMIPGYLFSETHLYVGNEPYPLNHHGNPTVAPGQFPYSQAIDGLTFTQNYTIENLRGDIYVIAHIVVCPEIVENPS